MTRSRPIPTVLEDGKKAGVEVIPGIEVTTLYDGREFHLLLPFVDWGSADLRRDHRPDDRIADGRGPGTGRAGSGTSGLDLTWDEVWEKAQSCPPLGVKIAQILLDKPESGRMPGAGEVLRSGKAGSSGRTCSTGTISWRANPPSCPSGTSRSWRSWPRPRRPAASPSCLIPAPISSGRPGKTSRTSRCAGSPASRSIPPITRPSRPRSTGRWPTSSDLVPTAGSDFHGKIKPHVSFGALTDGRYWMVEELRKRRPQ